LIPDNTQRLRRDEVGEKLEAYGEEPMKLREAFEQPIPLLEQRQTTVPYPVDALGSLLGPVVERMADVIGVPCAMAAQSVLATAALACQGHANVCMDGRLQPLSLFFITVAASGDRKSAVDQLALQGARDWERQQWTAYAEKLKAYRAAAVSNARLKAIAKSNDGSHSQLSEPAAPRLITTDPTIESLVKNLCYGLPSMGLFNDDAGQFLGGTTMSNDNRLKAITTLSKLWDGSAIDRARSMDGESLRAYDRRLSLHLMLQPYLASPLLSDPMLRGQGILGRCLISWPERLVGQRLLDLPLPDRTPTPR
jgi:hypothetical protein